jgi:nucleoid DNA-binding protein
MTTPELLDRIAAATGQPPAAAADQLDRLVTRLVTTLRQGKKVKVKGLGVIRPAREESQ